MVVAQHHTIAGLEVLNRTADGFDHARAFMAKHDGLIDRKRALEHGDVGVAQAGGHHPYPHFIGSWGFKLQGAQGQRRAWAV
jgi:hypothetical protein